MKRKATIIISYLSVFLNVLTFGWGFYLSANTTSQEELIERYNAALPFSEPITSGILFVLTILSLIVLARQPTVFPKVLAVLQTGFAFLYIWGRL